MIPVAWLVAWCARGNEPAGSARHTIRRIARADYLARKAAGFTVTIDSLWS